MSLGASAYRTLQESATDSSELITRDKSHLLPLHQENPFQGFQSLIYLWFPS